jgi:hypothetical protein
MFVEKYIFRKKLGLKEKKRGTKRRSKATKRSFGKNISHENNDIRRSPGNVCL